MTMDLDLVELRVVVRELIEKWDLLDYAYDLSARSSKKGQAAVEAEFVPLVKRLAELSGAKMKRDTVCL